MTFKIIQIDEEGNETVVGTTDVPVASMGVVYDSMASKVTGTLDIYSKNGSIKSEDKAGMISSVLNNLVNQSMSSSLQVASINKDVEIKDENLQLAKRKKAFILDRMRIDNNTAEQKYFTEQSRNGGVSFKYVFYKSYWDKSGNMIDTDEFEVDELVVGEDTFILFNNYKRIKEKTIGPGTGLSTVDLTNLKIVEETAYITNQSNQLTLSVGFNNKLRIMDTLGSTFGNMAAGGIKTPQAGWDYYFGIASELTTVASDLIAEFADKITKI